ncbi:MAG: M1 family aminopeptidase [Rhizomicrobium sp.]
MFRKIAAFELRYQLSAPVFWVSFLAFFALTFMSVTIPEVQIGDKGNTNINSPFAIIQILQIMSIFSIFIVTAFVANVVVRDDETGYGPIIRSTRITKFDYMFGRFTGAFLAGALAFASVPLAILIGSFMPWLDVAKVGPFRPEDYLYAYFVVAIPTLLVTSAAFFALATATRSMLATYIGVVAFLILNVVMRVLFREPQYDHVVGFLEPFGIGAISEVTKYWTAFDRNTLLPPIAGVVAENRLIWFGISFLFLSIAYTVYRFETRAGKRDRKEAADDLPRPARQGPLPAPHFDSSATLVQAWKWTRFEMGQVFRSPAFFVLLALGLINGGASLWFANEVQDYITYPVTRQMIVALRGAFTFIPVVIAIYYAGELVWRERDRKTNEIFDSCPVPDWVFALPKMVAIVLVLLSTFFVSVVAAVIVQTLKGYTNYELVHYLTWYVLPEALTAIQVAVLAVFVQAVVPGKYWGWGIMAIYIVATTMLGTVGYEDHLYIFGTTPEVPLSDMNGEGQFWIGRDWFDLYWSAGSLILAILAYALWRRGTETRLRPRFARLPRRLAGFSGALLAFGVIVMAASGAFIYYNTHILNEYRTDVSTDDYKANYEKALLRFENTPQPKVTYVALDVAIYPHDPRVVTTGTFTIQNRTGKQLSRIDVRWDRDLEMKSLVVDGAEPVKDYGGFHYVIFGLKQPMAPGAVSHIAFTTVREQKGFRNEHNETRIVDNGTFLDNYDITPALGMSRDGLLRDPSKRRRHGLAAELRPPELEDDSARAFNVLRHDADWVNTDITVSTVADQTPIAPGYRVSEQVADGRRTVRFKSDSPIGLFFSIQSAAYAVKRDKWHNVDLAVYYGPQHAYDVDLMLASMKASFDVYTKEFSPFQFHQMRILEFPVYAVFAQSFANTVPFSEGIGFLQDSPAVERDPKKFDMVTFVTAHELGHQWWGHQVVAADMQGGTMLVESFAQYSALLVMEHLYGPDRIRNFLKSNLDRYLRNRGTEEVEELPLDRVEDQGYIHYGKGAVVMYRLKEAVGQDVVDRSLRRLIAQYAFQPAPYPSTRDFLKILREEAGPKYNQLITDLFEKITIYDLKATGATWKKRNDGEYDVAVSVEAHKFYADGKGKETETPMDEQVPIGAFLEEPGKKDFGKSKVLYLQSQHIVSGRETIHLVTDCAPAFAGIDPYNEWIDRNSDDNVTSASAAGS